MWRSGSARRPSSRRRPPRERPGEASGLPLTSIYLSCHMTLMSLQAAILGFLALEPTTGYTLKQRFDGSVKSFWSVTQSQVYRELHSLEAQGSVAAQREPG